MIRLLCWSESLRGISKMAATLVALLVFVATFARGHIPEDDFRIINRLDLLAADSDLFVDNTTESFSQLLVDVARDQLVVGAKNALYRLSLRGLRVLESASWPAPAEKIRLCQIKGRSESACHNYIKILLTHDNKLFACGTNAFSPICSWREIESVGSVRDWVHGEAKCPHNPRSNVTAILTTSGEYYVGTPTDFASSDSAIYRSRGDSTSQLPTLRTHQYDPIWLNEPQFVGSFEDDLFVYFVFREVAIEFMNCGKIIYSRIGRVCKNDTGGHIMMRDNWSTFLKARLNCSQPGEFPFYYDEVQSITYMQNEKLLIATFTTPRNSIAGSAVCVYNMAAIDAAFDGAYKVQKDRTGGAWESRAQTDTTLDHFRCRQGMGDRQTDYHLYQLMHDSVQPMSDQPVYQSLDRFTHVTADVTATKNTENQYVLFVATEDSRVLKLAVEPRFAAACVVEVWRLSDERNAFGIESMQFVEDTTSVYFGGREGVLRISAHHCGRHTSRASCLGAADPYCAWEEGRERCRQLKQSQDPYATQSTDYCPVLDMPVDGGWSSWSDWEPCVQDNNSTYTGLEKPDFCQCRTRQCSNPKPSNGGQRCKGASIAVSQCTVHGGWSSWSAWSACSASCGIAVKTRRRSCSAPAPRHGGRLCVGQDSQEIYCSSLPPCPDPILAAIDGGWSAWSQWSACSGEASACGAGGGWRERDRTCNSPSPQHGGAECEGDSTERERCDLRPCDYSRSVAWTPWVEVAANSSDGSYTEKRFKFVCKAQTPEQIKLTLAKEEARYCEASGCSAETAQQARARRCRRPGGAADAACDLRPRTEWSCWSEWSECSGECGADGPSAGYRRRTRQCLSPGGCEGGAAVEKRTCLKDSCGDAEVGWGEWSSWSVCKNGERIRKRACEQGACSGPVMQVALCGTLDDDDVDNELNALPIYSHNVQMASFVELSRTERLSVAGVVGCVVASFIIGCVITLCLAVYFSRRRGLHGLPWRRRTKVPSSPHYITAKQNSYVTVPLQDVPRKAKRQPSFTGISSTSGGLVLSKSNNLSNANNHNNTLTTPKLYPKAIANEYDSMGTLRKHQHRNNIDPDEEKFY